MPEALPGAGRPGPARRAEEAARRAQAPAATPHRSQRRRRNPAWLRGGALRRPGPGRGRGLAVAAAVRCAGSRGRDSPEAADAGGQSFEKATPAAQVDGPDAARAAGPRRPWIPRPRLRPTASADSAASTREVSARARRGLDASEAHASRVTGGSSARAPHGSPPPAPPAPPPPPSPPAPPARTVRLHVRGRHRPRRGATAAAGPGQGFRGPPIDGRRSKRHRTHGRAATAREARRDRPEAAAIHFDATAAQREARHETRLRRTGSTSRSTRPRRLRSTHPRCAMRGWHGSANWWRPSATRRRATASPSSAAAIPRPRSRTTCARCWAPSEYNAGCTGHARTRGPAFAFPGPGGAGGGCRCRHDLHRRDLGA